MTRTHGLNVTSRQLMTSLLVGAVALVILGVQPLLFGALLSSGVVSLEFMGIIIMAEIVALGVGAALGEAIPSSRYRSIVALALLGVAASDLVTAFCHGAQAILVFRILAGLCEGIVVWSTACIIVRSEAPERNSGYYSVLQVVLQIMFSVLLSNLILPRFGWSSGFSLLALVSLLTIGLVLLLPRELHVASGQAQAFGKWSPLAVLPLVIAFLQQAALGAAWSYLEPMGQEVGLSESAAANLISWVLFVQLFGGIAGAALAKRISAMTGVTISGLFTGGVTLAMSMLGHGAEQDFSVLAMVFGFFWPFVIPFQVGVALKADPSGKVATLVPAAQILGVATGPLVAALFIEGHNVWISAAVAAGFSGAALLCCGMGFAGYRKTKGLTTVSI